MARPATARRVGFASQVRSCRPPRDDELSVMREFAEHAAECHQCEDPYRNWKTGKEFCKKGHSLARDVATYIYSKGGRPCSVVDKKYRDERNEIEVPVSCDIIRNLTKAFDRGLNLTSKKPIVSHDSKYYVSDRQERPVYDRVYGHGAVVIPSDSKSRRERGRYYKDDRSRRPTSSHGGNVGSLYHQDEREERSRRRYDEPVIIIADPHRRQYER